MDRFDAMRVFTRVVERRSFSLAADDLGLPRSTVTDAVKSLEARLGVRLLERTTRQVRPTLDGEAYYRRCLSLIADLEDAEGAFGGARPKGLLRLEVQGTLARHFLLPNLPGFFAEYPDIEINMSESDRWIDLIREGVDCVLRFGHLPDSDMIARQVVMLERLTCAAPGLFRALWHAGRSGRARRPSHDRPPLADDGTVAADGVHGRRHGARDRAAGDHVGDGTGELSRDRAARPWPGAGAALSRRGRSRERGTLVQVLSNCPPPSVPVSLLYPRNRQLSPRVRVFIDYVTRVFGRT